MTGLPTGAHLIEVGCATGKATLPLARRGFRIPCLEPGAALAAGARTDLGGLDVEAVTTRFEDWGHTGEPLAMLFAATAWHWLDPAVRHQGAAGLVQPGGFLALWSATHVIPRDGDRFVEDTQEVHEEMGESVPPGTPLPRPQELPDERADVEASSCFDVVDIRQFDRETVHDAEQYIDLLETVSGHIAVQDWQRDRLHTEIRRRLARRPDGLVRRHWGCVLHVARRTV